MEPMLDPGCPGASAIREEYRRRHAQLGTQPGSTSRLGQVVDEKHREEEREHLIHCARCMAYVQGPPSCDACGRTMTKRGEEWVCTAFRHSFVGRLFGGGKSPRVPTGGPSPLPHAPAPERPRVEPMPPPVRASGKTSPTKSAGKTNAPPPGPQATRPAQDPSVRQATKRAPEPPVKMRSVNAPSAHEILGVKEDASDAELRKAYHQKARQYHPDTVAHMAPEFRVVAEQKMKELNAAYEALRAARKEA